VSEPGDGRAFEIGHIQMKSSANYGRTFSVLDA
jgi:hypothetical protein